jgi:DNA polymerase-3 subunit epsilon
LKNVLKARGYRWSDGSDGRPRAWWRDVPDDAREEELRFLKSEIYGRDAEIVWRKISAFDRFSRRI